MKKIIALFCFLSSAWLPAQVTIDQVVLKFDSAAYDSAYIQYTSTLGNIYTFRGSNFPQNGCLYNITDLEFRGVPDTFPVTYDTIVDIGYLGAITDYFLSRAMWDTNPPNTSNIRIYMDTFLYDNCATTSLAERGLDVDFRLFPNPAQEYFTIETMEFNKIEEIEVFDVKGQQVARYPTTQLKYSTELYESGIYFVKVKTAYGEQLKKLIIKK